MITWPKKKQYEQCVTCINSLSTRTQEWGTAAPLASPSCPPVRRVRKSSSCWRKPSTGSSSLPWGDPSPRASIMSSPGMIFTTRPGWMVDHRGTHRIHYNVECEHLTSSPSCSPRASISEGSYCHFLITWLPVNMLTDWFTMTVWPCSNLSSTQIILDSYVDVIIN